MRKLIKTIVLLLLLTAVAVPVLALAAGGSVTAQIPFTVKKTPGTVVIEAVSEGAPMPDPAKVENTSGGAFEIAFTEPGDYFYRVFQQEGRDKVEFYDTIEYDVGVYVMYDSDGGLTSSVVVSVPGQTKKPENGIEFINPPPTTLEVEKIATRDGWEVAEVFAGEEITYEIKVSNTGRGTAYNVVVLDTLPTLKPVLEVKEGSISDGGVLVQNGKAIQWKIDELPAGEHMIVRFAVIVPEIEAGVTWLNKVQVTFDDPEDPTDPWLTSQAEIWEDIPHAVIDKDQARNGGTRTKELLYVAPGDEITYHLTMTNDSRGSALNASITDEIPEGLTLVAGSISHGGTVSDGVITWKLGDLMPGESVTVNFRATVPTVTEKTVWTNQGFAVYTDGSKAARAGILGSSGREVNLQTDIVEAVDEPEPTTTTETAAPTETTATTETTASTVDPDGTSTPKTGDDSQLRLWLALMVISLLGIAGAVIFSLRQGKRSK